jgi:hypothetical protein
VRRRVWGVGTESAEVHDLPHACVRGLVCDHLRRRAILLLEVARAERVDEVVDDLRTFQGGGDAVAARCVSDDVADAGLVTRALRETAVSSCSATSGTSARPTTPVAPKTVTFTNLGSATGARSSGG